MFLSKERETLEKFFPGLDEMLLDIPLMEMENQDKPGEEGNPAIKLFPFHLMYSRKQLQIRCRRE